MIRELREKRIMRKQAAKKTANARESFPALLRSFRDRRGLTQEAAAEELRVNLRTLQNWEIGRNRPHAIAERFLREILGGD